MNEHVVNTYYVPASHSNGHRGQESGLAPALHGQSSVETKVKHVPEPALEVFLFSHLTSYPLSESDL